MFGTTEYQILEPATATTDLPPAYTDCHSHGADMYVDLAPVPRRRLTRLGFVSTRTAKTSRLPLRGQPMLMETMATRKVMRMKARVGKIATTMPVLSELLPQHHWG